MFVVIGSVCIQCAWSSRVLWWDMAAAMWLLHPFLAQGNNRCKYHNKYHTHTHHWVANGCRVPRAWAPWTKYPAFCCQLRCLSAGCAHRCLCMKGFPPSIGEWSPLHSPNRRWTLPGALTSGGPKRAARLSCRAQMHAYAAALQRRMRQGQYVYPAGHFGQPGSFAG
jgi:hypothetical protein